MKEKKKRGKKKKKNKKERKRVSEPRYIHVVKGQDLLIISEFSRLLSVWTYRS